MKRSIITNLLLMAAVSVLACGYSGTHNYYIFKVFPAEGFKAHVNQLTLQNWKVYTDGAIDGWYDAETVRETARKKGDQLMLSYVDQLDRYLDCASNAQCTWNYPTKEELAADRRTLLSVRNYAQTKLTSRLRSQHALLFMRCNMMLGLHDENVTFWEQTANRYIETVYKEMMYNIYAGALLKTGRTEDGCRIFAEQGDKESLYTVYYEKRSLDGIRREYQQNPNSPVLPFLIEDFANNAQEAYDATHYGSLGGKLFIRDIQQAESRQMCAFARQVISEGKTENPALWKSLEAWLLYLLGDRQQAVNSIEEAKTLGGSQVVRDNARVLSLYIWADQAPINDAYYARLSDELQWVEDQADALRKVEDGGNDSYENYYTRVYERLVHMVLMDKFDKAGQSEIATALMGVFDEQPKQFHMKLHGTTDRIEREYETWNPDYCGCFFVRLDTISAQQSEAYLAYTQKGGKQTPLDKWLSKRIRHDDEYFHEVVGTKYLREGRWDKAISHLEQVSLAFINDMNIAPYMAHRTYTHEPWVKRQRLGSYEEEPRDMAVTTSQKLEFAREMQALEKAFKKEKKNRAQMAYDLALRYYQASFAGDCWYLTHYGTGVYDYLRPGEMDMIKRAGDLLEIAATSKDFLLKEKALYAAAFIPTDQWLTVEWNESAEDFLPVVHRQSQQYTALRRLVDFYAANTAELSPYVSNCDVIKEFRKLDY